MATFALTTSPISIGDDTFIEILSKNLPAGNWTVVATANITNNFRTFEGTSVVTARCELRNGAGVIGRAIDRRFIPTGDRVDASLTLNGGAAFPEGGTVSLWCTYQGGPDSGSVEQAQMMITQVGGFF
jgi:hypothetical protein